jgi:hypothetical protein
VGVIDFFRRDVALSHLCAACDDLLLARVPGSSRIVDDLTQLFDFSAAIFPLANLTSLHCSVSAGARWNTLLTDFGHIKGLSKQTNQI